MNQKELPAPVVATGDPGLVIKVLEVRWKLPILFQLNRCETMRFADLARSIPHISKRMLTQQLKQMQIEGLVLRLTSDGALIRVEYQLADWCRALRPSLASLTKWAQRCPEPSKQGADSTPPGSD